MLEEALFTALKDDPVLASKLDAGNGRVHIYPLVAPDGVVLDKAITYTEITQSLIYPLLRTSTFQISCFAKTYPDVLGLAEDIDRILNDLSETKLGGTFGVKYVKFDGRTQLYDDKIGMFYIPVDIKIKY